jgi:hypothetical protein
MAYKSLTVFLFERESKKHNFREYNLGDITVSMNTSFEEWEEQPKPNKSPQKEIYCNLFTVVPWAPISTTNDV